MKTKTYFAFRVDIWDDTGDSIVEHVAGVDDFGASCSLATNTPYRIDRSSPSSENLTRQTYVLCITAPQERRCRSIESALLLLDHSPPGEGRLLD